MCKTYNNNILVATHSTELQLLESNYSCAMRKVMHEEQKLPQAVHLQAISLASCNEKESHCVRLATTKLKS